MATRSVMTVTAVRSQVPLPFTRPDIGESEIAAVTAVLRSGWLTTGEQCRRFEDEFRAAVGASHAVAVNSCTAALHLSLEALDVGPGDLVFLSPYTFAASAEVIRYLGATPVFVDIDPLTLNISPTMLRAAVLSAQVGDGGRPRVVMPVHIAGVPCEMNDIRELARATGMAVVEDAAHAFPAAYRGRPVGSAPAGSTDTACFSFYATKTITTGEGGMLTTESEVVADRARSMSLHGLSHHAWSRYANGGWAYDIVAPGYKYNLSDIAAAMGIVQLERAAEMAARRTEIARRYDEAFTTIPGLECPVVPPQTVSAWHLYVLRLDLDALPFDRDEFVAALSERGIGTSVHFIPLHLHSYYTKTYALEPDDFPVATAQFQRVVSLPIYSLMSDDDVARVIAAVEDVATCRSQPVRASTA